jgi:uncharacterized protein YdhG (YjbR/CyaY superfamily)
MEEDWGDVEAYFGVHAEERATVLRRLHELIVGLYPGAVVSMKYRMPTYHVGEGWVAVANQKRYVSLYTCDVSHIEEFKRKNPNIKTGRGCINFTSLETIPYEDVRDVVIHAFETPKGH